MSRPDGAAHEGKVPAGIISPMGDVWGGTAAMLVALPSAIAFGVLAFSPLGPAHAGEGAVAGILGAAALGIVAPLVGRAPCLISAPCAPAAAVLSALAATMSGSAVLSGAAPLWLLLTMAAAALLQAGYGLLGGGRLIKYLPFPVVTGYLSAVALLIALGQIPKLLGLPPGTRLALGLASPELWKWQGIVVGTATILAMTLGGRVIRLLPAPVLGLAAGTGVYFLLALFDPALRLLAANPHIIGPIPLCIDALSRALPRTVAALGAITAAPSVLIVPALTLSVLLSIDTLKTCVGLEMLTRRRPDPNRTLIGQGAGNLLSALIGGMPGAGTMGPTLVNVTSGGTTVASSLVEGVLVAAAALLLGQFVAWIPLAALAGILLVIACRMFDLRIFELVRYRDGRLDFAVIAAVIVVAAVDDLMTAAEVGVGLAILLFLRNQVMDSVIRRTLDLTEISSKTRRLPAERQALAEHGREALLCELDGDLFFGTSDQLLTQLEQDLKERCYFLFDLRRVHSLDSTAAHLFQRIRAELADKGGRVLFCGLPSPSRTRQDFRLVLERSGLFQGDDPALIVETLDGALEWMEEAILRGAGVIREERQRLLEVGEMELFAGASPQLLDFLQRNVVERFCCRGERIFTAGETGDEMFLVRSGSVRIVLPLEGGKVHHLATIGPGDFFGELSFLDREARSASVEAKEETALYLLSSSRLDQEVHDDPRVGTDLYRCLAGVLTRRLRSADAELRTLQER